MVKFISKALMILSFFLNVSCIEKKIINIPNIPNGIPVASLYDYTYFVGKECTVKMSIAIFSDTTYFGDIKTDSCILCGEIFARDGRTKYSGERFDGFKTLGPDGFPHIVIPSLAIDTATQNGYFELAVPGGTYDLIVYADGYQPIHKRIQCNIKTRYSMQIYLGTRTLH